MSQKEKYLEEYEKYKHIKVEPGLYIHTINTRYTYEVLFVDEATQTAELKTVHTGNLQTKTLHWCRKYLKKST